MKKLLLLVFAVTANLSQAQILQRCATTEHQNDLLIAHPEVAKNREKLERFTQAYVQNNAQNRSTQTIITIPVVFHILYSNATQNISTARILEQMNVLNNDYAKLNSDTGLVPPAFQSVAANTQIQFCLAQQDPTGAPTNGILRVPISGSPQTFPSNLSAPWSRDSYLNIYVGNFGGGLLGVAQLPGGPANTDYVNALYTTVGGPNNPGTEPAYDLGRTLTHEIGHWLNLYHTFQGGCAGLNANNCATAGDNVCDTPPTSGSNFGCPGTQNTCTETSPFPPPYTANQNDMTMNYMDYVDDVCMYMFTSGQGVRMAACINGARASLLSSQGCVPPSSAAIDGGISAVASPAGTLCASAFTPSVTIKNFGTGPLTSAVINYAIDNGAVQTQAWSGNLASLATATVALTSQTVTGGSHTFTCFTTLPNAVADPNTANDTTNSVFTIATGQALPYQQPFTTAASFVPAGWTLNNPDGATTWAYNNSYGNTANGSMWVDNANYNSNGQVDEAVMQPMNLTGGVGANLSFWVAYTYWTVPYQFSDTLEVLISTDCGATYSSIYKKWGNTLATAPGQGSDFFPTASQWRLETVSLMPYITSNNAIIKFRNITDYENNLFVDDINISITTGIKKITDGLAITLNPNPASSFLNVKVDTKTQQDIILKVTNNLGQVMMTEKINTNSSLNKKLDVSHLANGIYQVAVETDGKTYVEKLVISK